MTSQRISVAMETFPSLSSVRWAWLQVPLQAAAWLCFSSFGALSFHSSWAVWGAQREELPDGGGGGLCSPFRVFGAV